jgi:(2Fe-2S) ferredoxin
MEGNQPQAQLNTLSKIVQTLGMQKIQRHLFICATPSIARCCSHINGQESWDYLKKRLKELKLDQPMDEDSPCVFRTKADCLRVCQSGPILVVYPDGVWYHSVTVDVVEKIIQEHLLNNQIVNDYVFLIQPLPEQSIKGGILT